MILEVNDDKLKTDDIEELNVKVRTILLDDDNNILIANYGDVFILPGGTINEKEEVDAAIIRELKEETGVDYEIDELDYLTTLDYYQKAYPKRNGMLKNRLTTIYYFVGKYKGVIKENQKLTPQEIEDGFKLELIPLDNIENIVANNKSNNPKNKFFVEEILTILSYYKKNKAKTLIKK